MVMHTYGHSRARLAGLAGRMWPAGRQLDNAAPTCFFSFSVSVPPSIIVSSFLSLLFVSALSHLHMSKFVLMIVDQ